MVPNSQLPRSCSQCSMVICRKQGSKTGEIRNFEKLLDELLGADNEGVYDLRPEVISHLPVVILLPSSVFRVNNNLLIFLVINVI